MKAQRFFEKLALNHPVKILLFFLLLTGAAIFQLPKLTQDPDPYLISKSHPARVNFEKFRENYTGSRDSILVMLESKGSIFNPETLTRIQLLTQRFEELNLINETDKADLQGIADKLAGESKKELQAFLSGNSIEAEWEQFDMVNEKVVESGQSTGKTKEIFERVMNRYAPVIKVTSIANTDNVLGSNESLDVSPIYEEVPASLEALDKMKEDVLGNRLFDKTLVSQNGKYAGIFLELALKSSDSKSQYQIYQLVKRILEEEIPGEEIHYVAGLPVITANISNMITEDNRKLLPVVFLLVLFCLWLSFRMFYGVLVPLLVVLISLSLTLAVQVLFQIPTNIISTALPVFILSIGVADGIHIFSEFRDHLLRGLSREEAISLTMRNLFMPVLMTSITTAAAFWALSVTEIVQMRNFGIFVGLGALIAMALSLVFIPALLMVLPQTKKMKAVKPSKIDHIFVGSLEKMNQFVLNNPKKILLFSVLILGIAGYGASLIKVDNNGVKFFKPHMALVKSTDKINRNAAGSLTLNVLVKSSEKIVDPMKEPHNLKSLAKFEKFLEGQEGIGKVISLTSLIKRINYVMNNNNPDFDRIPDTRPMISQYILLYENGGGETLTDVVNADYSQVNLRLVLNTNSSFEISKLQQKIDSYASRLLPAHLSIEYSGSAQLNTIATREIVTGQINSFSISLVLTSILLIITFRSIKKGLISIIPLLSTVVINFGIMGFAGVALNIGTAVVSSIVIGIGVDYSIHYLSRLTEKLKEGESFNNAAKMTIQSSGKAIVSNSLTVGIGFIAMTFSGFQPLITLGWLVANSMLISSLATIILIPAILIVIRPQFAFDKQEVALAKGEPTY